eukprot:TRINITY_DN10377_c0_g1_i2.p1 TRINITY_DN10377_c0_g1~~TRINITY_DN10377_c0_g1_i2.p1  ORF type:complete len:666 (+),score=92.04 TRINITY_DN10377_c0_g1_i2:64-2061(+)
MSSWRELLALTYVLIPSLAETPGSGKCLLQYDRVVQSGGDLEVENDSSPLVSVIMPVRNMARFLPESTGSLMNQTLKSWELVLVDVSSSDGSLQLENSFALEHPQAKVIRLESRPFGGAGIPSNTGMSAATGKYIAFLDPDDKFDSTFMEKMVQTAEESHADLVVCNAEPFSTEQRSLKPLEGGNIFSKIPKNVLLSQQATPEHYANICLLNPGPWRKLYLRSFLEQTGTQWAEGDFFYEDNRLHWSALLNAQKVVVRNETLIYHRVGVSNQTTHPHGSLGARAARWAAILMHMQGVGLELSQRGGGNLALWQAYFRKVVLDYKTTLRASDANASKYGTRLKSTLMMMLERYLPMSPLTYSDLLDTIQDLRVEISNSVLEKTDLSIVIPVHKVPSDLEQKMRDLFDTVKLKFEVFFVYDRIDNDSIELLQRHEQAHDNVFVFESMAPNAGRARNTAYPLLLGDFTFFFDADDAVNFSALEQAVREAQNQGTDVMLLRYNISRPQPATGQLSIEGMLPGDTAIWTTMMDQARNVTQDLAATERLKRSSALRLINYPWKQLTKTKLLQERGVFFGPNSVHNDVQFHWHSLAIADRIRFSSGSPVCTHLKSGIAGASLTEVRSNSRLEAIDALWWTHRVLLRQGFFGPASRNKSFGLASEQAGKAIGS